MGRLLLALIVCFVVLNIADVVLTLYAVNTLRAGELNPVVNWIWHQGGSLTISKALYIVVSLTLTYICYKRYWSSKVAEIFSAVFIIMDLFLIGVIANNIYIIHTLSRGERNERELR